MSKARNKKELWQFFHESISCTFIYKWSEKCNKTNGHVKYHFIQVIIKIHCS
jgi:hypothetical protein